MSHFCNHMHTIIIAFVFILSAINVSSQSIAGISRIHYFYNSGWLVETDHHLLVFDFIPYHEASISFDTLIEELKKSNAPNKEVLVFISHDHQDHFNDSIFSLTPGSQVPEFITGWKPSKPPAVSKLTPLSPGESLVRKGLSVFTHAATDDGSAFLVKIDGVFIYHAGDHALWVEELLPAFTKELKGIKAKAGEIDLAFIPAARGMFTQCAVDSTIEKGVSLCAEILQPKVVALQHIGCDDKLFQYEQTHKKLAGKNARWISPVKYDSNY